MPYWSEEGASAAGLKWSAASVLCPALLQNVAFTSAMACQLLHQSDAASHTSAHTTSKPLLQGMGWLCIEELVWGDKEHKWVRPGMLFTKGPGKPLISSCSLLAPLCRPASGRLHVLEQQIA